jgi:hypothetical protein
VITDQLKRPGQANKTMMRCRRAAISLACAIAIYSGKASAQVPPVSPKDPSSATSPSSEFSALIGRWVRPDGGYVITVKAVDANGKLDASYTNPNLLPFYTAEVTRDGENVKLFFELRAGGYNGSTYNLNYDAASDQLKGVYHQAVAKQKFDVVFRRMK